MSKSETRLSHLAGIDDPGLRLDRSLLKDRAAETLRDYISTGRIPEGTKLTEREVSRMLGISRMPAHEALTILEAEGLVVSRPGGRYVIELDEKDVRDLITLRASLESLAVQLAAELMNADKAALLRDRLHDLEEAVAEGDPETCTKCDVALHQEIWRQSENRHLLRVLDSVLGAIFVLADRVKIYGQEDLHRMLNAHRRLVEQILAGDAETAVQTIQAHMRSSLTHSLRTFKISTEK